MDLSAKLKKLSEKLTERKDIEDYRHTIGENLDLEFGILFDEPLAHEIQDRLEEEVEYYDENSLKVRVFGKWHPIPRKMVRKSRY